MISSTCDGCCDGVPGFCVDVVRQAREEALCSRAVSVGGRILLRMTGGGWVWMGEDRLVNSPKMLNLMFPHIPLHSHPLATYHEGERDQ